MLRGFSSGAIRSRKNFMIRRAICFSSLSIWRAASAVNSIRHAMLLHDFFKRYGLFTLFDLLPRAFSKVDVLQVIQMLKDSLSNVVALGSAGTSGQLIQA